MTEQVSYYIIIKEYNFIWDVPAYNLTWGTLVGFCCKESEKASSSCSPLDNGVMGIRRMRNAPGLKSSQGSKTTVNNNLSQEGHLSSLALYKTQYRLKNVQSGSYVKDKQIKKRCKNNSRDIEGSRTKNTIKL